MQPVPITDWMPRGWWWVLVCWGGIADHFGGRDQMVGPEPELACVSLFWRDLSVDVGIDGVEQQSGKTPHAGDHIESGGTSR